jgi:hypothetical protein
MSVLVVLAAAAPAGFGSGGCAACGLPASGRGWAAAGAATKIPVVSESSEMDARMPAPILVILERILSQFTRIEAFCLI